jgi:subtilase family serine protease
MLVLQYMFREGSIMKISIKQASRLVAGGAAIVPLFALAMPSSDRLSATTPGADAAAVAQPALGVYVAPATSYVPESSLERPGDAGRFAHTHFHIRNVKGIQPQRIEDLAMPAPADNPEPDMTFAEYPATLSCVYKMGPNFNGCYPRNNAAYNATGGERAIALVLAYDNPTALADLQTFSSYFGLPAPNFTKVFASGNGSCVMPPYNAGWALESSLDTQWSHAMAPMAKIILVEACSNSYTDLMYAETVAEQQLLAYGGGQVSNSWGGREFPTELTWDPVFRANWAPGKPISFFFSSGDSGDVVEYPAASPWVVAVGGTTVNRDPVTRAFQSESCWNGSGGGVSQYETFNINFGAGGSGPWTDYQYPLFGQSARRVPDIAADADPASGAYVYSAGLWYMVGGTSLAAPMMAGIVNNSGNRLGVAPAQGGYFANMEDDLLYAELFTAKEYQTNFYDVTTGGNGILAGPGYDLCTGVGTPRGKLGK